ncbi:LRR receptor-like serine/threonine-protein kinase ERECTA [Cinnamomum micranthum f. kanehirae]|uniref:LRR receptor-like serine/threonine-protein kinase ERECTA n=1 Tax=Cinnamomum micranthum f. kanehirae TaxID=337451 RepID=A0A443N6M9_9MAGN|nr:LRR receptor-like serine/threonine-protein kinase ERECTA [Cinnamomum micranthum f. kanehirae]
MNSLTTLFLSYNQFTGTIPSSIFKNLTNLMIISTSHNQFNDSISFSTFLKGTIPLWLLNNLIACSLILRGNFLKGPFLLFTQRNNSMLQELDIFDNIIFGELHSNIDALFPNLIVFNMSQNEL